MFEAKNNLAVISHDDFSSNMHGRLAPSEAGRLCLLTWLRQCEPGRVPVRFDARRVQI